MAGIVLIFTDLHILKEDASSSFVLERQQLLSVLPLLVAVLLEEVGEAWKGHIISGEVEGLGGQEDTNCYLGRHHPSLFGTKKELTKDRL